MRVGFAFLLALTSFAQKVENPALEGLDPVLLTDGREGLDPVLLTEGREEPGQSSITAREGQFLYQFANAETRERFTKDPGRYAIQLDGACARMGAPTTGNPDSYYVFEGKIYIFASTDCYKAFKERADRHLESKQPAVEWRPTAESRAQ